MPGAGVVAGVLRDSAWSAAAHALGGGVFFLHLWAKKNPATEAGLERLTRPAQGGETGGVKHQLRL